MKSNDTYLNILVSYAYLNNAPKFIDQAMGISMDGTANIMIDSGAFTVFNAKQNRGWLTVDNYCKFLHQYGHQVEKYVMLDVIGNDDASKDNYEEMVRQELNPMFVYTMVDNDVAYLKDAVKRNEHICVAGGVTTKGDWMRKRYQDVYAATKGKIHGLGYVTYPDMMKLPLHSVDSSSWKQAPMVYGLISYFENGMKGVPYMALLKRKKKFPLGLKMLLERIKVTPKQFSDLENHKGNRSISMYCALVSYMDYQKFAKNKNLNLFLAATNTSDIDKLLIIKSDIENNQLDFNKFKAK